MVRLSAKDRLIVGGGGGGITGGLHRRGEARLRVGVVRCYSHRRAKRPRRRLDPRQVEIDVAQVQVRVDQVRLKRERLFVARDRFLVPPLRTADDPEVVDRQRIARPKRNRPLERRGRLVKPPDRAQRVPEVGVDFARLRLGVGGAGEMLDRLAAAIVVQAAQAQHVRGVGAERIGFEHFARHSLGGGNVAHLQMLSGEVETLNWIHRLIFLSVVIPKGAVAT